MNNNYGCIGAIATTIIGLLLIINAIRLIIS